MALGRAAGRSNSVGPGGGHFSLGWNAAAEPESAEVAQAPQGKRWGPQPPLTKEMYAAALREQIAAAGGGRPLQRQVSGGDVPMNREGLWDEGPAPEQDPLGTPTGSRRWGPQPAMSKENYAAALREQIAAREAQRGGSGSRQRSGSQRGRIGMNGASVVGMHGGPGEMDRPPLAPGLQSMSLANMGAQEGSRGYVADSRVSPQAAYAAELKAQIDARAAEKAEARRAKLVADREDDVRVERESAAFRAQASREKEAQANRHRLVEARADALERFLDQQGKAPVRGAVVQDSGSNRLRRPSGPAEDLHAPWGNREYGAPASKLDLGSEPAGARAIASEKAGGKAILQPGGRSTFSIGGW